MILVLLLVSVILTIAGVYMVDDYDIAGGTFLTVGIVGGILSIIVLLSLLLSFSGKSIIDDRIKLYQEENTNIEQSINTIVESYKKYESETYTKFKSESPTVLISLFPELKTNELVNKQIELYVANNIKIKELKEQKLTYRPMAWWLYFGN